MVTVLGTIVNLFYGDDGIRLVPSDRRSAHRYVYGRICAPVLGRHDSDLSGRAGNRALDSIWSLILPVAIAPFNLIVIRQFFMNIPSDMIEAGIVDGANDLQIFGRIILPLSKPALAAFSLFYAVTHWNNYFAPILYINDPSNGRFRWC